MTTESTILDRVAAGEPLAVEGCIVKYRGLVWSIARRFVGARADAEDAVQEVFIELWKNAGRFDRTMGAESTFVATVARRRLIDRHRRRARRPKAVPLVAEPAATARSDTEHMEELEEGQHARRLLEKLRPEQRQVLKLSFDQGMSQQEIAESTKLPLGTIKTHTRRGLMRLRQLLETGPVGAVTCADSILPKHGAQP